MNMIKLIYILRYGHKKKNKGSSATTEKEKTKQIIYSQQLFVKIQDDRTHKISRAAGYIAVLPIIKMF